MSLRSSKQSFNPQQQKTPQQNPTLSKSSSLKCIFCLKIQSDQVIKPANTNANALSKTSSIKKEEVSVSQTKSQNEQPIQSEEKEHVLITNIPQKEQNSNTPTCSNYFKMSPCLHIVCIKCIARMLFTSNLNNLPLSPEVTFTCQCNEGSISLSLSQLNEISELVNQPDPERLCPKHGLILYQFCIDCKKNLCKKCDESHSDLFTNHNIVKEEPPNASVCMYHPNCFLDMLCKDCKCQICHLCLVEGNKHFCHNAVSFDVLKEKILTNVSNMKYDNYEDFESFVTKCDEDYNNKFNSEINSFNNEIDALIEKIKTYKEQFNVNMQVKLHEKNEIITILKNIYRFFYKEYAKVSKSVDYPVLCMYQIINSELIDFTLSTPDIKNTYIDNIQKEISHIEISPFYKTKYQFSLKSFSQKPPIKYHSNTINSLCTLKDGRLVSASEDKTVIIWDYDLTTPSFIIEEKNSSIKVVQTLNDGRLICGGFKELKIYNDKFKCVNVLKDISNHVSAIFQLEDGRIISGSYREMRIFNMTWNNNYKESKAIRDHSSWVKSVIGIAPKMFASASDDMKIFIYDYAIKCIRTIKFESEINSMCNAVNDSEIIYIGDTKGRMFLYNFTENVWEIVSDIDQHHAKITNILGLVGGNYATASCDGKVILRDVKFMPVQYLKNSGKAINAMAQLGNGNFVCGGEDGVIYVFE
jgi:hypothetical protein